MQETIKKVCEELTEFLLAKNKAYGDSASNPVRIFSKTDPLEQINIRIDDKLSRIARGNEFDGDDTELDLIGYLVLKRAIKRKNTEDWQQDADIYAGRKEETLRREAPGRSGYQGIAMKVDLAGKVPPRFVRGATEPIDKIHIPAVHCTHKNTTPILPEANYGYTHQCLDCGEALDQPEAPKKVPKFRRYEPLP